MRKAWFGWVALALVATAAAAQLVVGNDQSGTATIWNVDPATGVATPLYSGSGAEAKPWGMAYDAVTNTLYWNNGSTLYSSPFGPVLVPVTLGTMTFGAGTVNFVALGFRNGRLYGTRNIATEAVYEIDPATLVATQVYVYNSSFDFGGLDFDATNGLLYGLSDTAPVPDVPGLYEIDTAAQTTTFRAPYPAGETDIDGLAVHAGVAYYVTDGPNTTQPNFYRFDVATGTLLGTLPSPFTGSGTFSAATFVPAGGCVLTPPADITVGTDPAFCQAVVSYTVATSGSCGTVTCSAASGSAFPLGTTVVSCTSSVGGGATSFSVTVEDGEPPLLTCPADLAVTVPTGQGGGTVDFPPPTVGDNCPGVAVPVCAPASGSFFPVGTTAVACTALDAAGNPGTCGFEVEVTERPSVLEIPTLSPTGLGGLALLLAGGALAVLRRRRRA